jgi:hexosaminidase
LSSRLDHVLALGLLLGAASCALVNQKNAPSSMSGVWPMPQYMVSSYVELEISPNQFFFKADSTCDIVQKAVQRYWDLIFLTRETSPSQRGPQRPMLNSLIVQVKDSSSCGYPQDGMNENYTLTIVPYTSVLTADTAWGVLRGLETFSQLVQYDEDAGTYLIYTTSIRDWPRFGFRGILLDTSRHYLPIKALKQNLEAMAFNKFNVFHWHIVDDQSWPLQMKTYSNLTDAAYHPRLVYSQQDVKDIIEFARLRGIRVLPEIDTPGHTQALGNILPEIHTPCKSGRAVLNVARNYTYEVITSILSEMKGLFVDNFLHLGMDEVDYTCWKNSSEITEFMKRENLTTYPDVEQYYVRKTLDNVRQLGTKYIIWQDPINNGVKPAPDTIVGVWLDHYSNPNGPRHGYKIILSAPWYLNYISYGEDWTKYYTTEPTEYPATAPEADLIIGGEACMWGEYVDGTNLFPRMWPRASAVAERLWSAQYVNDTNEARIRLNEQRCRMLRRGMPAQPLQPGYCGDFEAFH